MVNLRLKRFSSRANDKHLRDGDFRTNPQVASVVHRNEENSMYDGVEKEWRDCVSEDGNAKVEVSSEAVLHRASELDKCAGYGYKAFSSNPKSRFKDIPFRRHKDFFKCPQLSHATKAMLVRKANDTANVLIRDSIEPDPISSIIWKYHSTVDGIQLFRGYDRGHGRSIMMPISKSVPRTEDMNTSDDERSGIACNSGARDRYITCIRGVTEVSASLEEFAMLFKMDTRKQCSDNSMLFNGDLLDTETLYPLVQPSGEHPRRLVAIKWSAVQSPSKLFRNRDFCYLECQKEFHDGKGRKGWVRSFHSVRMSCCPSFEKEHGVVRGSLYRCGLIAIESETKPGVLDTTYTVEIDLKGRVPEKIIRSFLCHRIASVGTVDKLLQRQRLSTSPLLGDLEIPAKQIRPTCHLCYRLFSKIFGAKRFICRRCGEAACANCCDYWVLDIPVIGTKRVCICTYCAAEARTNHTVPLSSRGKARVFYTPRRLAAYEHMGSANKFTDDTISDTRERGDSYSHQPVLPVQCVPDARTRAESDCRAHKAPLQQQAHGSKDEEAIQKAEALLQKHYSENAVERLNCNSSIPHPETMQQTEIADRKGMPERARSEIIKHNTIPFFNETKHQSLKKNVSVNVQAIRERERAGSQAELTKNGLGNSSVGNGSSSTKRQSVDTLSSSHTNPSSDICVADSLSNDLSKRTGRSEIFEFVEGDNGEWIAKEDVGKQSQADSNQRNTEPPKEASSTKKRLSQLLSQEQKTKQSDGLEIASSYDSESLVDSNTDADDCPGCGTKIQQIMHDGIAIDICFCPNNRPPVLSVEDMQHSRVHTYKESPVQYKRSAHSTVKEQDDLKAMSRESNIYSHPFESLEDELMEPLNPHDSGQIPNTGNCTPRSQRNKPFETRPPLPLPNAATFSAIMDLSWFQRMKNISVMELVRFSRYINVLLASFQAIAGFLGLFDLAKLDITSFLVSIYTIVGFMTFGIDSPFAFFIAILMTMHAALNALMIFTHPEFRRGSLSPEMDPSQSYTHMSELASETMARNPQLTSQAGNAMFQHAKQNPELAVKVGHNRLLAELELKRYVDWATLRG